MADDPLVECPSCEEPHLRKVINSAGIVFKGSGFYVTDNRNGVSKSANGNSKNEATTPASTTDTDTKPAAEKKSAKAVDKAATPA